MAEYKSAFTGPEIDAAIGAVAGKQPLLVSGENIKTINNLSLLGSGNIDIQGGGGGASIRIVDASDPADWGEEGPTQACLMDVLTNEYQILYITNIPSDEEGMVYAISMILNAKVDVDSPGNELYMRQYIRYDEGEEDDNPELQSFIFSKEGSGDAEMEVESYPIGGGSSGEAPIYTQAFGAYENGNTGQEEFLVYNNTLGEISDAIDAYKEVVLRVDGPNYDDNMYYRISNYDRNGRQYIEDWGTSVYLPSFICETPYGQYYAEFDRIEQDVSYAVYKIIKGTKHYQPTNVKFSTNSITFDNDELTQIWIQKRAEITVNVDESGGTNWVAFKKTAQDDTYNAESITWSSEVVIDSSHAFIYKLVFAYNQGVIETSIYKYELTATPV